MQPAGMTWLNHKLTTHNDGVKIHSPEDRDETIDKTSVEYQSLVGDLIYLADCTRLDLDFIVGNMGSGNHETTYRNWDILKAEIRYVHGTKIWASDKCQKVRGESGGLKRSVILNF